jgi:hypothetical protein
MSKKVQYQRKEVMSQSSDSEDPLQLRRSLDSEDEDSAPASHQQKGNASKNSQLSKNSTDAPFDNAARPKRTRSRRRRSQKSSQHSVVASTNTQAPVKAEQPVAKVDLQKRKGSYNSKPVTKETTVQPTRDKSPTVAAHARRSSRDKADTKARPQRGQRNEKPVKFVPKQQKTVIEPLKPVVVEVPKPVTETKTSQLEALHGGQADVRQAPDERTAPQSPSSEQQLSPVIVTPLSPSQYADHSMPMHPVYMPPAGYAYMPPAYYYPYVPQPVPYYYYPSVEYYPMQPQHGAYVDARGQVYYDLEPQLLQQQIRQHLFTQPPQMENDKENTENHTEHSVAHIEQKFVEVIKIHDAPKPEQTPIEPAAVTETTENTQLLSTEHVRSKPNTALKARNAPKSKKAPVWVPKSTVKTTVTPANVS